MQLLVRLLGTKMFIGSVDFTFAIYVMYHGTAKDRKCKNVNWKRLGPHEYTHLFRWSILLKFMCAEYKDQKYCTILFDKKEQKTQTNILLIFSFVIVYQFVLFFFIVLLIYICILISSNYQLNELFQSDRIIIPTFIRFNDV